MIQVVLMDGKRFINGHKDFDGEEERLIKYIKDCLRDDKCRIIEISKWVKVEGGGHMIPRDKERE